MKRFLLTLFVFVLLPTFVFAVTNVRREQHVVPFNDNAFDLGSPTSTWRGVYTQLASTTNLTVSGLGNSSTLCLQINNQGVVSTAAAACGTGGGGSGGSNFTYVVNSTGNIYVTPSTTPAGLLVGPSATSTLSRLFSNFSTSTFATSTNFAATNASTTNATTSNLNITGQLDIDSITSALLLGGATGIIGEYGGVSCTNQFVRSLDAAGAGTCATVISTDVDLADLTAGDTTLTFSGTYDGQTARTIVLNLGNANTWTALQTFNVGVLSSASSTFDRLFARYATSSEATTTYLTVLTNASTSRLSVSNGFFQDGFSSGCTGNDTETVLYDASSGKFTCGTDATGGGGSGGSNWTYLSANSLGHLAIQPSTTIGILVNASSSIDRLFARFATTTEATTTYLSVGTHASTSNLTVSNVINQNNNNATSTLLGRLSVSGNAKIGKTSMFGTTFDFGNGNNVSDNNYSASFGQDHTVTGNYSFTAGKQNTNHGTQSFIAGGTNNIIGTTANGVTNGFIAGSSGNTISNGATDSQIIGFSNTIGVDSIDNIIIGSNNVVYGSGIVMIGTNSTSSVASTGYTIGNNLGLTGSGSVIIGAGVNSSNIMTVSKPDTIYLGTRSTIPTLTVSAANGSGTIGGVGIGTTSPTGLLTVHAIAGGASTTLFLVSSSTASQTTDHFVVKNTGNVGVGTFNPTALFTVNGLASTSNLTVSGLGNTGTECLQITNQGVVDNTGAACGSGSPGGSDTQIQYNNSSSFGGISGFTYNGSILSSIIPLLVNTSSSTINNLTIVNSTTTNATTTYFAATNSSTTHATTSTSYVNSILRLNGDLRITQLDGGTRSLILEDAVTSNTAGSLFQIQTGAGQGSGGGGNFEVNLGAGGATGQGGDSVFTAGAGGGTSGRGGNIRFFGGAASGGNSAGGTVDFTPGLNSGTGAIGNLIFYEANGNEIFRLATSTTGTSTFVGNLTLSGGMLVSASSTILHLTSLNSTTTNGTTTYLHIGNHASTSALTVSTSLGIGNPTTTYGMLGIARNLVSFGSGTSSFANGLNISGGCFSISGVCVGGTVNNTITDSIPFDTCTAQVDSTTFAPGGAFDDFAGNDPAIHFLNATSSRVYCKVHIPTSYSSGGTINWQGSATTSGRIIFDVYSTSTVRQTLGNYGGSVACQFSGSLSVDLNASSTAASRLDVVGNSSYSKNATSTSVGATLAGDRDLCVIFERSGTNANDTLENGFFLDYIPYFSFTRSVN